MCVVCVCIWGMCVPMQVADQWILEMYFLYHLVTGLQSSHCWQGCWGSRVWSSCLPAVFSPALQSLLFIGSIDFTSCACVVCVFFSCLFTDQLLTHRSTHLQCLAHWVSTVDSNPWPFSVAQPLLLSQRSMYHLCSNFISCILLLQWLHERNRVWAK